MRRLSTRALALLAALPLAGACGATNFDPQSKIGSVRVLATRADKPYALPGDKVTLDVLAFDGRSVRPRPMQLSWLPVPCIDPPNDAYFGCFPAMAAVLSPGQDLTSVLAQGTSFSFQMPADVITRHKGNRGNTQYGLAVVFGFACAGHVEYTGPKPGLGPNAVPFGCFDEQGNELGPDDFVFSFSQVYSFTDRTNTNPVIDHLTYNGATVDLAQGITVQHCTPPPGPSLKNQCPTTPLGTWVEDASQEKDPGAVLPDGTVPGEQVWVDYYYTDGRVAPDVLTLFDPKKGRMQFDASSYTAPALGGEVLLWAVVHDNRVGAAWVQVPVHSQ